LDLRYRIKEHFTVDLDEVSTGRLALCGCTKQFDKAPICYVNRPLRATAAAKYQQMMNYPG
jgi:hypothetical protein